MNRKKYIVLICGGLVLLLLLVVAFFWTHRFKNTEEITMNINNTTSTNEDENQNYWHGANFTKANNGYYYLDKVTEDNCMYLRYYDPEQQSDIPVCGKADCTHSDSSCNAYLSTGEYLSDTIYSYQDNLYVVKIENGMAELVRIKLDGSSREVVGLLFPNDGNTAIELCFHGSDVYAFNSGANAGSTEETTNVMKRLSLDGKTTEDVFSYTGVGSRMLKSKCYGNEMFFVVGDATIDKKTLSMSINMKLYVYDFDSGITQKVSDQNIYDYCVDTNTNTLYYFVTGDGLYSYQLDDKNQQLIRKADDKLVVGTISFDGSNLYVSNGGLGSVNEAGVYIDKCVYVLDTAGNEIRQITIDASFGNIYFGDDKYLFAYKDGQYVYLEKSTIINTNAEMSWKPLNNN